MLRRLRLSSALLEHPLHPYCWVCDRQSVLSRKVSPRLGRGDHQIRDSGRWRICRAVVVSKRPLVDLWSCCHMFMKRETIKAANRARSSLHHNIAMYALDERMIEGKMAYPTDPVKARTDSSCPAFTI
jgi:hypothetical protein